MPSSACQTCALDRKSTRLNSSHTIISYAAVCLKKDGQPRPLQDAHLLIVETARAADAARAAGGGRQGGGERVRVPGGRSAVDGACFFFGWRRPGVPRFLPTDASPKG